jgi:hypothetical protein
VPIIKRKKRKPAHKGEWILVYVPVLSRRERKAMLIRGKRGVEIGGLNDYAYGM